MREESLIEVWVTSWVGWAVAGAAESGHSSVVVIQLVFRRTYLMVFPSGQVPAVLSIAGVQVVFSDVV